MRQAMRWRYYCDHCKKSGGGRYAMEVHEKHCTANPARECRMCDKAVRVAQVLLRVPELKAPLDPGFKADWDKDAEAALVKVRKACLDCPACILAVIRQSATPLPIRFDYKEEALMYWAAQRLKLRR